MNKKTYKKIARMTAKARRAILVTARTFAGRRDKQMFDYGYEAALRVAFALENGDKDPCRAGGPLYDDVAQYEAWLE